MILRERTVYMTGTTQRTVARLLKSFELQRSEIDGDILANRVTES
jgi:hypothetical protein